MHMNTSEEVPRPRPGRRWLIGSSTASMHCRELAESAGTTYDYWKRIANLRVRPSIDLARTLAELTGGELTDGHAHAAALRPAPHRGPAHACTATASARCVAPRWRLHEGRSSARRARGRRMSVLVMSKAWAHSQSQRGRRCWCSSRSADFADDRRASRIPAVGTLAIKCTFERADGAVRAPRADQAIERAAHRARAAVLNGC
jgi:hypothetical protein